jgi:predicted MFS family arabinose efflux permease
MTPLALLFILAFLVSVDVRILGPVLPSIAASLGAIAGSAGLAMTSYALAMDRGSSSTDRCPTTSAASRW